MRGDRLRNRSYRSIPSPDRSIYIDRHTQLIDIDRAALSVGRYRSISKLEGREDSADDITVKADVPSKLLEAPRISNHLAITL
jgi:hypothetical protein